MVARRAAWSLLLAPLARPVGPAVRRLLGSDGVLVVPETDREDLVADYLPRLQRHLPVTSSDGSVDLPEPAEPRLALHVTWVSVENISMVLPHTGQVFSRMVGVRGFP